MKNRGMWALINIIVLLGVLTGISACGAPAPALTPIPKVTPAPIPKATPTPTPTPASLHLTADGRLSFVDDKKLTFRTSGNVAQINVNEMDRVTRGQVLTKLDTTSQEQAVRTAELGVKTATLALKSAESDRKQAEYGITAAETDLKTMQANAKSAAIDLENANNGIAKLSYPYTYTTFNFNIPNAIGAIRDAQMKLDQARQGLNATPGSDEYLRALNQFRLAQDSLITAQQSLQAGIPIENFGSTVTKTGTTGAVYAIGDLWTIQAAQLAVGKAQLALENAQNAIGKSALAIDGARNALNKAQVAVDKANNDVDIANNNLNVARTNLENAIITAPFDGVIADVNVKVGDFLSSSSYASTVAVEIIDPSRMELDVNVNELDIPKVQLGQKVTVSVDALPGKGFQSTITSISSVPGATSGVVSYEVKIVFDAPENSALKAGMAATADITVG